MPRAVNGATVPEMEPITLTVPEVAEALKVSQAMAWALVGRGEIPSFKVGRLRRVEMTELRRYMRDKTREEAP